jgi:hypothetical protein
MGNSSYMNCKKTLSIDNYGVHGPSGNGFIANAILKINGCTNCTTTDGIAGTYLLDHVELILPKSFPTILDKGALNEWDSDKRGIGIGKLEESFSGYQNLRMIYYWLNGYEGRIINTDCYQWTLSDNKYSLIYNSATAPVGVDAARQTCIYSTSPSYDYRTFMKEETGSVPERGCIYYLFETLEAASKDFDYNDVGLRVSTPVDNGDGTFTANVQVMCVGNKTKTTVLYNGEPFGEEVHSAIGTAVKTPVNTSNISREFRKLGEITFDSGDFRTDCLGFTLSLEDENGNITMEKQPAQLGEAPLYLVVNGNKVGKWFWPREGVNIGIAYQKFNLWASDVQTAIDWYDSSNSSNSKIITY